MEFHLVDFLPSNLVHALGVTLFHSLWVGVILAVITSIVIILTRKQKAALRYNLLTACLGIFVLVMAGLFYQSVVSAPATENHVVGLGDTITVPVNNSPSAVRAVTDVNSQVDRLMNLWVDYSSQIVLVWFLIIFARSIQLMAGIHSVSYLKKTRVFDAGRYWDEKVIMLSAKLEISRTVSILQSGLAKVPLVAGHFKPVILLPLGLLNGLSTAEVEAIISHELAHVKRSDYIVNILQSFVEIVFFFNPAVLWISKLIREERENCCDDLALSCTGNKQDYIKALISCQEFQADAPELTLAITGRKNQLVQRVSRIVFNNSTSLNGMEKTLLTTSLVFTLLFTAAFTQISKPVKIEKIEIDQTHNVSRQDTSTRSKTKTLVKHGKKKPATVASTTTVKKNNLSEEQWSKQEEIAAAKEDVRAAKEEAWAAKQEAWAAKQEAFAAKEEAKAAKEEAKTVKFSAKAGHAYTYSSSNGLNVPLSINIPAAPAMPAVPAIPAMPAMPAMPAVPPAPKMPNLPPAPPAPHMNQAEAIKNELIKDGLISDTKNMSYKLNKNELTVNGTAQSDAVRQKYVKKFLKSPNQTIETRVTSN